MRSMSGGGKLAGAAGELNLKTMMTQMLELLQVTKAADLAGKEDYQSEPKKGRQLGPGDQAGCQGQARVREMHPVRLPLRKLAVQLVILTAWQGDLALVQAIGDGAVSGAWFQREVVEVGGETLSY